MMASTAAGSISFFSTSSDSSALIRSSGSLGGAVCEWSDMYAPLSRIVHWRDGHLQSRCSQARNIGQDTVFPPRGPDDAVESFDIISVSVSPCSLPLVDRPAGAAVPVAATLSNPVLSAEAQSRKVMPGSTGRRSTHPASGRRVIFQGQDRRDAHGISEPLP